MVYAARACSQDRSSSICYHLVGTGEKTITGTVKEVE